MCNVVVLPAVKRTEKAMRNKLSVQQGEEGDEEEDEMDVSAKDKHWGKSKRGYYGADTEEYEVIEILAQTAESCTYIHRFTLHKVRAYFGAVWHEPKLFQLQILERVCIWQRMLQLVAVDISCACFCCHCGSRNA